MNYAGVNDGNRAIIGEAAACLRANRVWDRSARSGGKRDQFGGRNLVGKSVAPKEQGVLGVGAEVHIAGVAEQGFAAGIGERALSGLHPKTAAASATGTHAGVGDDGTVARDLRRHQLIEIAHGPTDGLSGLLRLEQRWRLARRSEELGVKGVSGAAETEA